MTNERKQQSPKGVTKEKREGVKDTFLISFRKNSIYTEAFAKKLKERIEEKTGKNVVIQLFEQGTSNEEMQLSNLKRTKIKVVITDYTVKRSISDQFEKLKAHTDYYSIDEYFRDTVKKLLYESVMDRNLETLYAKTIQQIFKKILESGKIDYPNFIVIETKNLADHLDVNYPEDSDERRQLENQFAEKIKSKLLEIGIPASKIVTIYRYNEDDANQKKGKSWIISDRHLFFSRKKDSYHDNLVFRLPLENLAESILQYDFSFILNDLKNIEDIEDRVIDKIVERLIK